MIPYDFSALESKFPETVCQMEDIFTSHEFLLKLTQQNQVEYIKALYSYAVEEKSPSPFKAVHKGIIQKLKTHTELVKLKPGRLSSTDIFGQSETCSEWEKVK
jgi:hypothetical protein